jgi:hypothetical protein
MNRECYSINSVAEIENILKKESKGLFDFDTTLKTNHAFVYYLLSGQVVLLPGSLHEDKKGLVFENKACYRKFLELDHFPIANDDDTIEEEFQPDILSLKENIPSIVVRLSRGTSLVNHFENYSNESISVLLNELKSKWNTLSRKDRFYSCLVLGEFLRQNNNGKWILLKRYGTFNPFYTPAIIYPNESVLLFWDYLSSYFQNKSISPKAFADLPYIQNPKHAISSPFLKNKFIEYKILD